jgi:glycosyltransferase involved in cell wall biosynthesis
MRLGLIIYGSLETLSGGYLYDRMLVEHLHQQGDQVEIISLPWQGYASHLAHNFSPEIRRRLEALEVDLLLQDELNHPSLFWLNRSLRSNLDCPLVAIVHHLRCLENRPAWQNFWYREVEKAFLSGVDGFLCNSRTTLKSIQALLPAKKKLLPYQIAYPAGDRLKPSILEEEIHSRSQADGPLQVLYVGNLIPRKGLHFLLEALKQTDLSTWQLTAAGSLQADPAYSQSLFRQVRENGLQNNVRFLDAVSDTELASLMSCAHILAMPSSYEGFGIVYLEGMSFGLPVLAACQGGAQEIVKHGENGFLVAPDDVEGLAGYLSGLAGDRMRLARMSLAARQSYLAHPGWDATMQEARNFLLSMVKH